MTDRPSPFYTDGSNDFAYNTISSRVPKIVLDVIERNHFNPRITDELKRLADDMTHNRPIEPPSSTAPDADHWQAAYQAHFKNGQPPTWLDTVWFYAETLLYHFIIEKTRYYETGIDPYKPFKEEEIASEALWKLPDTGIGIEGEPEEKLHDVLALALWGNRIDLSMAVSMSHGVHGANDDDLLIDDREKLVPHLLSAQASNQIHIVMDNAGTELAMDLLLADLLLQSVPSATQPTQVWLHIKHHPTFISDTVPADIWQLLDEMEKRASSRELAQRLRQAWAQERLIIVPHIMWNSSSFAWKLPLQKVHIHPEATRLVITKGDMNYRRFTGDTSWPADVPFKEAVGYMDVPLAALRAMKCDALVGIDQQTRDALQANNPEWRSIGKYGLIQSNL